MTKEQIINNVVRSNNQRWIVQRLLAGNKIQFNLGVWTSKIFLV